MRRVAAYFAFALLSAWPHSALAFSGPAMFTADPLVGGGGGRFFTGSVYDGYTCKVCHAGGPAPRLQISGLPIEGYVPGTTYEVQITWAEPELSHALTLEFVGAMTGPVREVALTDAPSQAERCDQAANGDLAAYVEDAEPRRILGVSDCRSATARFLFTAPQDATVAFSLAMVRSDGMGTPEGDGVFELTQTLRRADVPAPNAGDGCSVQRAPRRRFCLLAWVLMMTGVFVARRRGRNSSFVQSSHRNGTGNQRRAG